MSNTIHSPRRVAIVGGGITGLAAAYELQEQARAAGQELELTLFDSEPVLGGKIHTERVNGLTIEGGPDCFLRQKPWATQLCQRLGLGSELMGTNEARRKTYVVNRGRLTPLPDGVMLIVPTRILPFVTTRLISWPGKLRMGLDLILPRRPGRDDESVGAFVRRRLGREALDKIAEPLMSGIHVSDPEQQSLLGTFPRFRALEEKNRSLILGMLAQRRAARSSGKNPGANSAFLTLRGGLGQLVAALVRALDGACLRGEAHLIDIERAAGGGYRLHFDDGQTHEAEAVILAVPAYAAARAMARIAPRLAQLCAGIRYVSTGTIVLAYPRAEVGDLDGFGYVVPRKERREVSACTFVTTKFDHRAPDDTVMVRCFIGGPGHEDVLDRGDDELVALARAELAERMGLRAEPLLQRVFRWEKSNPQYDVGHLDRVAEMKILAGQTPGLFLAGSAYEGVGVPDCVKQGQQAADKILAYLFDKVS